MPFGKNRSVDASRFSMVPRQGLRRSAFDISHTNKTTFNAGYLVPVFVNEVLPGESFRVRMTAFARLSTPIVPIMDNMVLESFFFFVPNRLVWEHWERFMGEQNDITDTTDFLVPTCPVNDTACAIGEIADYFGISWMGGAGAADVQVNALPFRAYKRIWNSWFRDEDLAVVLPESIDDGPDGNPAVTCQLQLRGKRHDYFTSARPWPQKPMYGGQTASMQGPYTPGGNMLFPQSGAPVSGLGLGPTPSATGGIVDARTSGGRVVDWSGSGMFSTAVDPFLMKAAGGPYPDVRVLINDIRLANSIQLLMERNARGGTRYTEIVRAHFGVTSPDQRLQRPEYLGGGRAQVIINPVAQTSASGATGTTTVLGELAGVGTAMASGHGFSQSFTEHGFIIGLVSVRADMTYQNGTDRFWFRRTKWDHFWPDLENLGEQAVLSKEIWMNGAAGDATVFGYQERWSEYKYKPNRVSGAFKSYRTQPLDMWHLAVNYPTRPVLNQTFIQESPPVDRVLQVDTNFGEQFLFDSVFDVRKVSPMAMFSIPGLGPRL